MLIVLIIIIVHLYAWSILWNIIGWALSKARRRSILPTRPSIASLSYQRLPKGEYWAFILKYQARTTNDYYSCGSELLVLFIGFAPFCFTGLCQWCNMEDVFRWIAPIIHCGWWWWQLCRNSCIRFCLSAGISWTWTFIWMIYLINNDISLYMICTLLIITLTLVYISEIYWSFACRLSQEESIVVNMLLRWSSKILLRITAHQYMLRLI